MKIPFTTVDVVIFTVKDGQFKVLLVQRSQNEHELFPNCWALPGGYIDVDKDADLQACALRKLQEKTSMSAPYLEQVGSWGNASRDPRGWTTTHVFFALLPWQEVKAAKHTNVAHTEWFEVETARKMPLAFDHAVLFEAALERFRNKVEYTSLPAYLLTEPFTLPQLQKMYENVLGRPVDKSSFRTRMLSAPFLEETGLLDSHSPRAPMGYRIVNRAMPTYFPRTFSPHARKDLY
ncbi:MAG: NUDIX hydrolase [Saezia sp.]